jgi:hypothetical protein
VHRIRVSLVVKKYHSTSILTREQVASKIIFIVYIAVMQSKKKMFNLFNFQTHGYLNFVQNILVMNLFQSDNNEIKHYHTQSLIWLSLYIILIINKLGDANTNVCNELSECF